MSPARTCYVIVDTTSASSAPAVEEAFDSAQDAVEEAGKLARRTGRPHVVKPLVLPRERC